MQLFGVCGVHSSARLPRLVLLGVGGDREIRCYYNTASYSAWCLNMELGLKSTEEGASAALKYCKVKPKLD